MNIYLRSAIDLYGLLLKILECFQFLLMCMCNNNILLIQQIDTDDQISYVIPGVPIVLYRGFFPRWCNEIDVIPLSSIYHVKNCKLQRTICKDKCLYDSIHYINFLNENINYNDKDKISKKYMFVEIGSVNITSEFHDIGWCFLDNKYHVSELKKIISRKDIKSNDTLILTDSDLHIE
jgi:hypothetical protein